VYDMYSWDQPVSPADEHAETSQGQGQAPAASRPASDDDARAARAVRAVQVALDRRDNGGDAGPRRPA
jgi:hypothetical protein